MSDRQNFVTAPTPLTTIFRRATVTQVSPLRVRFDGDATALPITPDSTVSGLAVSDRVRVMVDGTRLEVMGRFGGGLPMRLSFPTLTALNAFTGWPGLEGFVEADNSVYVWQSGWKLWAKPWASYMPTWTNLTLGNGTVDAGYSVAAGLARVGMGLAFGSTTTVSGVFFPSMPVSLVGTQVGEAWAFDASSAGFASGAFAVNAYMIFGAARASASAPWAWAPGDLLRLAVTVPLA